MRALPILLLLAPAAAAPTAPAADPMTFFNGRTESSGVAKIMFRAPIRFAVHSSGRVEPGEILILDQLVDQQGQPPERREWRIHRSGPARFDGSLSSAVGPISGSVEGNVLHLKYQLKNHHLYADQDIRMAPDGRSAVNHISLSRFGVAMVSIDETIHKD